MITESEAVEIYNTSCADMYSYELHSIEQAIIEKAKNFETALEYSCKGLTADQENFIKTELEGNRYYVIVSHPYYDDAFYRTTCFDIYWGKQNDYMKLLIAKWNERKNRTFWQKFKAFFKDD